MEEILKEILKELKEINSKLSLLSGDGEYKSLTDICTLLLKIQGDKFASLSDIADRLEMIQGTGHASISDISTKLISIDSNIQDL